jgi:hypothetical protein
LWRITSFSSVSSFGYTGAREPNHSDPGDSSYCCLDAFDMATRQRDLVRASDAPFCRRLDDAMRCNSLAASADIVWKQTCRAAVEIED